MTTREKKARTIVIREKATGTLHYRKTYTVSAAIASVRDELAPVLEATWASETDLIRIGAEGIAVVDLTKAAQS